MRKYKDPKVFTHLLQNMTQKFDDLFMLKVISQHVICGFLMKKGKVAKLSVAKKRWFFMISSVTINGDKDGVEKINQSDIPSVFKLDSIYYFAYES